MVDYRRTMSYVDMDGDTLDVTSGMDETTGKRWILFEEHAPHGVSVNSEDSEDFVRKLVGVVGLNEEQDFVVAKKVVGPALYVAEPVTAPLGGGHMFTNEEIEKLVTPGDIFQGRESPEVFARVVEVKGGTIVYVAGYSLFNDNPLRAELRTPFARFIGAFSMWRPALKATMIDYAPSIPERLASAGYTKDKVEVKVFKPEVEEITACVVAVGDKIWLKDAAHEVIGNEEIVVGKNLVQRISFRNDTHPVTTRTLDAKLEMLKITD